MSRRVFGLISTSDLVAECHAIFNRYGSIKDAIRKHFCSDLGVGFSLENLTSVNDGNVTAGGGLIGVFRLGNGLTYWGILAGGDWESPVYFILYWDGRNVRAYVPTDGNVWNTDTNRAYGNDSEADLINIRKRWDGCNDVNDVKHDLGAIINDLMKRFQLRAER